MHFPSDLPKRDVRPAGACFDLPMNAAGAGVRGSACLTAWSLAAILAASSLSCASRCANPPAPRAALAVDATSLERTVGGVNRFGFDLYAKAKRVDPGNIVFSPTSIAAALSMTRAGARGETEAQMTRVMHLGGVLDSHAAAGRLLSDLRGRDGTGDLVLRISNRLWVQSGGAFEPTFVSLMRDRYAASLGELDFARKPERARETINDWIACQTSDRIKNFFPYGSLSGDVQFVVTNAVFFHDRWRYAFDPSDTSDEAFATPKGKTLAKMMHRRAHFAYAHLPGLRIVELPYRGGLSMVIFLPDAANLFSTLEEQLATGYAYWTQSLSDYEVDVKLPKWKGTMTLELAAMLKELGMPLAFELGADFSGMGAARGFHIGRALHEAFIEVSEKGTEAAAATGFAALSGIPRLPEKFHADRPFIYVIRDPRSGAVLFMGRVIDPR
jgi:serpin B